MTLVVATGTFDLLHPGHVLYLERSKALGDELVVIVARDVNVRHKPKPILPEDQRRRMVDALKAVDRAILGEEKDIFRTVEQLRPDIITLGYDQHFDEEALKAELFRRGLNCKVVRIEASEPGPLCSSSRIVARILERFRGRRI
ncbi:MAG TPA: FAD synthase [Methanothrix sp.]|nr:FAD synthase [Methanothrix sp.]HPT20292.1 FAD synthase [Methanothrix sp.]